MERIRRIYVEKKPNADVESRAVFNDIKNNLGISTLTSVRLINCYDMQGIDSATYEKCKFAIFAEPTVDILYEEKLPQDGEDLVFAVKYLPGQFDQRADSAMQSIQILMDGKDSPGEKEASGLVVESAKVYMLKGVHSEVDGERIKKYLINPVDSREVRLSKPETLNMKAAEPESVPVLEGFRLLSDEELEAFRRREALAMSSADILHCRNYFREEEKRDPTISEIKVLDTYWSDHCRHTTFQTQIENVIIEEGHGAAPIKKAYAAYIAEKNRLYENGRATTLMNIAQIGMKSLRSKGFLKDLDESPEINACSIVANIDVDGEDEEWLIMFKNETHNHPTEIEPYGGAATCLGGAIRDPLSGRSYVYQAMRVTGSGDPRKSVEETLEGKLPQRKITTGAAHGYSSYGNQIGIATGQVSEIYHEGYVAKRMEVGAVIGAAKKENVIRQEPAPGDVVILVGGRTGRDGCGGATGSSKEHTEESIHTSGAEVQKGNPPTERKLQRLFRNPAASRIIKRCNDFGAGGVSVAIGELADGLSIDLSKVPKKYEGLDGTELAISESQERMAVVVAPENAEKFIALSREENLEATAVAVVTEEKRLVMAWRGQEIVNISRAFLNTNGAPQFADVYITAPGNKTENIVSGSMAQQWRNTLSDLNVCAQKGLTERFDATIGAATVLMPFGGIHQLTPGLSMAAKVPVPQGETNAATLMSYGFDPFVSQWSPFHGALYAVVDSVNKIVCTGGNPEKIRLSFQEYFERLGTDSKKWGKPFAALLGGLSAQIGLKAPSIGGKDSMSGSFMDRNVPPTLISFAVSVADARDVISPEFKEAGSTLIFVDCPYDEDGVPDFEMLNHINKTVYRGIQDKSVKSAHNIGIGGIAAALSKMAFGNGLGFEIDVPENFDLFSPCYGGFLLEVAPTFRKAAFSGFDCMFLGHTAAQPEFKVNGVVMDGEEMKKAWIGGLEDVFPTRIYENIASEGQDVSLPLFNLPDASRIFPKKPVAKPKVFIPAFPGTNCEWDTAKAFQAAGAETEIFVVKNLTVADLQQSITRMAEIVKQSQILALPGGFSCGDEPDGSGKFIAAVFRNPGLQAAVMDLIHHRDGLAIGICNGFQALIKLGLVPFGEIKEMKDCWPTLTYNEIGRHISCVVRTKVVSNKSPWLYLSNPGDVHSVAVSHGEGRFVAQAGVIEKLHENGQIATQYVDGRGQASMAITDNPNGSFYAVEGITSPDGRILGKMGHSERVGRDLYKNVPGNMDQKIFESGVHYFS